MRTSEELRNKWFATQVRSPSPLKKKRGKNPPKHNHTSVNEVLMKINCIYVLGKSVEENLHLLEQDPGGQSPDW